MSAPRGIVAPVAIRLHSPAESSTEGAAPPAAASPAHRSATGSSLDALFKSAARTAQPSIAETSLGGWGTAARNGAANTLPSKPSAVNWSSGTISPRSASTRPRIRESRSLMCSNGRSAPPVKSFGAPLSRISASSQGESLRRSRRVAHLARGTFATPRARRSRT